jgi:hypothetical protein
MREIKFRAWVESEQRMTKVFELGSILCDNHGCDLLMQYTGLKDKNGREIYEGDILLDNAKIARVVKWGDDLACFMVDIKECTNDDYLYACLLGVVIGNIYENPDLR